MGLGGKAWGSHKRQAVLSWSPMRHSQLILSGSCVNFVTEQRNIQNTVFCEESFGKNLALYVYLTYKDDSQRWLSFSKRFGPRIMLLESLPNKQSPYSFLRLNKWEIYQLKLWKHWQKAMITDVKKNKLWSRDEHFRYWKTHGAS